MRTGLSILFGFAAIAATTGLLRQGGDAAASPNLTKSSALAEPAQAAPADAGAQRPAAEGRLDAQDHQPKGNALIPAAAAVSDETARPEEIAKPEYWSAVAAHLGRRAALLKAGLEPTSAEYQAFREALQQLGNESKLRTPYPFFHRSALEAFTRTLYVEPLALSREQSRQLAELAWDAYDAHLLGVDPSALSARERYALRDETVAAIQGSLQRMLTPAQATRWGLAQESSTQIQRGDVRIVDLGLGLDPAEISDRIQSHWAATYAIDGDAKSPELASLAQRYLEQATNLLESFADDDAALQALSRDEQAELHSEMLRVQVGYEEEAQRLGAPAAAAATGGARVPPTLVRFRYGRVSGTSSPLLVAF